jgi:hypothetical protein
MSFSSNERVRWVSLRSALGDVQFSLSGTLHRQLQLAASIVDIPVAILRQWLLYMILRQSSLLPESLQTVEEMHGMRIVGEPQSRAVHKFGQSAV